MKGNLDLKEIINGLRQYRGAVNEVAKRHGCSTSWVRDVLQGKWNDPDLVLVASQVWLEYAQAEKTKMQQAADLAAQAKTIQLQA